MNKPNLNGYRILIQTLGFTQNQVLHAMNQVPNLVDEAVKRIEFNPFGTKGLFVGHSGGKDSSVVRWLADQAGQSDCLTVHIPKPNGADGVQNLTRKFLYELDRSVLYMPNYRFEAFGLKTQIDGTRMAEAQRRGGRGCTIVIRGKECSRADMPLYLEDGLFGLQFVYPIFDWTDLQVWATIFLHNIPFSKEYYIGA